MFLSNMVISRTSSINGHFKLNLKPRKDRVYRFTSSHLEQELERVLCLIPYIVHDYLEVYAQSTLQFTMKEALKFVINPLDSSYYCYKPPGQQLLLL